MIKVFKVVALSLIILSNGNLVYAEDKLSNLQDVENNIYQHLIDRDTTFEFEYTGDKNEFKNNITKTIKDAYSKDDYTERSWLEIKPKASSSNNKIYVEMDINYLTTKDQEKYVDDEINNVMKKLLIPGMNDIEKVRAVNDYLVNRYEYDYTYRSTSAYSALKTGKAICQGYSTTAYKMLTYANIPNRIVVGTVNGESHSWNYIKINNQWYYLDITNNDVTKSDKYFLVGEQILKANNYMWNKLNYPEMTIK